MMNPNAAMGLFLVPLLALSGLTACGGDSGEGGGYGNSAAEMVMSKRITLSGDEEVPPVKTGGTGTAEVTVSEDMSRIDLSLEIAGAFNGEITQAHFHRGAKGENGPVLLWVCANAPITSPSSIPAIPTCPKSPGSLKRSFTAADLPDSMAASFSDVAKDILAGRVHINVHTTAHPAGEIRGQATGGEPGGKY